MLTAALMCALSSAVSDATSGKPNIPFIFADDMSYETIGSYGLLDIATPHRDTLVERGTSFTHACNMGAWNGAVCLVSRAMLNTGRFVWDAWRYNNTSAMEREAGVANPPLRADR